MTDLARLRSLEGLKWSRHGDGVLPAWVADMDFPPPSVVTETMVAMVERGDLGYNVAALEVLADTWAAWQQRRHRWRPPTDELWLFTGAMHALEAIMVLDTRPGDGVVVLSPIYAPFREAIVASGRRLVDVALDPVAWRLDPQRLADAIDPGTRLVLMCQPHNPTGRIFDEDELHALADIAEHRDLLIISDEVWGDLVHAPHDHRPLATADPRLAERLVTIGSASKAFNIAGLRCAIAHVGVERIRRSLRAFPPHLLGSPSTVSAAASVAAWTGAGRWLADTRETLTARRDHLLTRLADGSHPIGCAPSEATYLAWLDFRATPLADDPARRLLRDAQLAVEPGPKFGTQGAGWARLNYATSQELLDEAIDRILELMER